SGATLKWASETVTSDNISSSATRSNEGICEPYPQLDVQVSNGGQLCDDNIIYNVQVCNTGTAVASVYPDTYLTVYPPDEFNAVGDPELLGTDPFVGNTLPAGACANYNYVYNRGSAITNNTYHFSVDVKEFICDNDISVGTGDIVHMMYDYDGNDSAEYNWCAREMVSGSGTGETWLDRNLGAYRVATASTDYQGYGDLYQWGRPMDGHHKINWTASNAGTPVNVIWYDANNTSDTPDDVRFIEGDDVPTTQNYDWVDNNNNNRWQTTPQGPCPTGYHVPTETEWEAELDPITGGDWGNAGDAFDDLALPVAGRRNNSNGNLSFVGSFGYYWSSNVSGLQARDLRFNSSVAFISGSRRAYGYSVRCLKD
ncbi:MAG: hypothetical protein GY727_06330, partial [Gammaproteobacteria bacterium]|nr:hypothetical protein [Gammaproteobacteria bacterium]